MAELVGWLVQGRYALPERTFLGLHRGRHGDRYDREEVSALTCAGKKALSG